MSDTIDNKIHYHNQTTVTTNEINYTTSICYPVQVKYGVIIRWRCDYYDYGVPKIEQYVEAIL